MEGGKDEIDVSLTHTLDVGLDYVLEGLDGGRVHLGLLGSRLFDRRSGRGRCIGFGGDRCGGPREDRAGKILAP
ncbi:MAG TPA: hypothetical protein DCX67_04515 [Opitutae bacterium]|nr:hypothetical protein [Opitutae bacterium]